jgi:RNA polymerase sigma factor (TIGR02999 family)
MMDSGDSPPGDVTRLLEAAVQGDSQAMDRLVPLVYEDLRRVAHRQLDREGGGHTLQTTALVHEAYIKLATGGAMTATSRAHFLAIAARAMRQVLVDAARARAAQKRGGGDFAVTFEEEMHTAPVRAEDLIALDDALERLEAMDARAARIVEYRFFGGLSVEETAAVLTLSTATVKRDWQAARAWLLREVEGR